ncbi:hypothetical protein QFZ28_004502 [Neobacillus niacini]|jgi:hypothetical protein|uniref:UPF0738 family protein n=1 Tax=Neobacillus niacini TaxID=86668 RepID=UPI00278AC3A3|nr:hypothetical protein [Neobacillus niacini]MDQ1004102.1 hypothetical protein [Neobacillus niacini]
MNKKLLITKANISNKKLRLQANEPITGLTQAEQILVDSKQFSFIYLMENQEGYTYIEIPEPIWPLLKESLTKQIPVWIHFNEEEMELTNFNEELVEVINNIRGNSNYGEEMVTKVEGVF